jgi:hypothetical protein
VFDILLLQNMRRNERSFRLFVSYTYPNLTDRDSFLKIREKKFVEPLNSAKPGCFRILVGTKADLIESGHSRKVGFGELPSFQARGVTAFRIR